LYGYETWSFKLKEEHRLRVFENGELNKIFFPKRDEVTGGWKKLHNEFHSLYALVFTSQTGPVTHSAWGK
jgi:hypothetical protein